MNQEQALKLMKAGHHIFLTGPAGSGKTHVLQQFIGWCHAEDLNIAVTASTGIAATHLGGVTIHSWAGIGISDSLSSYELDELTQKEFLHKRFKFTDVLVIDEISMLHSYRLDLVDMVLRAVRGVNEPFGGIQVVMCGDFFQLPPVNRSGSANHFAFEAAVWQQMDELQVCYLETVYRQSNDPLLDILNELRSGQLSESSLHELEQRLNIEYNEDHLPTKLFTHNKDVDAMNAQHLAAVPAKSKRYHMTSSGPKAKLKGLKKNCLAPEELELKEGARVMFLKNNYSQGYVNGTLGTVVDISGDYPMVETDEGKTITVSPETWVMEQGNAIQAEISQLPLRLAWAITVHKSQGMTLDSAQIDLSKSFVPGMGYVALSRVRSLDGLFLLGMNQQALAVSPQVQQFDSSIRFA